MFNLRVDPRCSASNVFIGALIDVYHITTCLQGKGLQTTYWLTGKEGMTKGIPTLEDTEDMQA